MPTTPRGIVTSIHVCRPNDIQQKNVSANTNTGPLFPTGSKTTFSMNQTINPFVSPGMSYYWIMRQDPFDVIMIPVTDYILSATEVLFS